jgi:hypothetical protein
MLDAKNAVRIDFKGFGGLSRMVLEGSWCEGRTRTGTGLDMRLELASTIIVNSLN